MALHEHNGAVRERLSLGASAAVPDLIMKAHDTWPPLQATLSDLGGAIDLSSATSVKVILKGTTVLVTGNCAILSPASAGVVSYTWATGDLAVPDTYSLEFEIHWASGGVQTVPNDGYKTVLVEPDLENA